MELLDWKEFAKRLGVKEETFRRFNWRTYRHIFVGNGRNLRSARFAWHEDGSHLEWKGGPACNGYTGNESDTGTPLHEIQRREKVTPKGNGDAATDIINELGLFKSLRLPDGSFPLSPRAIK